LIIAAPGQDELDNARNRCAAINPAVPRDGKRRASRGLRIDVADFWIAGCSSAVLAVRRTRSRGGTKQQTDETTPLERRFIKPAC
jgi:hypothetical protein